MADADVEDVLANLSAEAISGLLWHGLLTDGTRKELQRHGLFYPRTADKTPLGREVFHRVRSIEDRHQ